MESKSKGALIGYARTSTAEQKAGLEAQLRDLQRLGVDRIYQEQLSSISTRREQLAAALDALQRGDTLVVTKLDRLARSVGHFVDIERQIKAKGAALRVLDLNLDTSTPVGQLMLNLIAAIAQFERQLMLQRQAEGIAKAKQVGGKYLGGKPTALVKAPELRELLTAGMRPEDAAKALGMSRSSAYRIIAAEEALATSCESN